MMCVGLLALKGKLFCILACAQTYTSNPWPYHSLNPSNPSRPITLPLSRQICCKWLDKYVRGGRSCTAMAGRIRTRWRSQAQGLMGKPQSTTNSLSIGTTTVLQHVLPSLLVLKCWCFWGFDKAKISRQNYKKEKKYFSIQFQFSISNRQRRKMSLEM